jgi:hypothetical protein
MYYVHCCGCLITYIHCIIIIMKSLEDRNNNNYCDIPLATSFPSPDLCKVLLSCFHDNVVESRVYIAHLRSLTCASKLSNVQAMILIYYLVIISCKTSCN